MVRIRLFLMPKKTKPGVIKMKQATEAELLEIRTDFIHFLNLNNGELKSAYLAASGRGFTNLVKSNRDAVLLKRDTDNKYLVCSYPEKPIEEKVTQKPERIIRFHTDATIFVD